MNISFEEQSDLLELARSAAFEAGALIQQTVREHSRITLRGNASSKTSRTDLVTEADRSSERLISQTLRAARPGDSIVGEEGAAHRGESDITWIIDPLDGTTNFVYGFSSYAVSIAAVEGDETVVGVVHDPEHNETFTAQKGRGAHRNDVLLALAQSSPPLNQALIGTGFGYTAERRFDQARLLPTVLPAVRDIRRAGAAALDLCYVAARRLDGYFEAGLKAWDRAAGLLVATESGCSYRDLGGIIAGDDVLVVGPEQLCQELSTLLIEAAHIAERGSFRN